MIVVDGRYYVVVVFIGVVRDGGMLDESRQR